MKAKLLLSLFLLAISVPLLAQMKAMNPVGTWKMVSQTGTDPDGKAITTDLKKVTQYKIITPTHWMFVSYDSDSLKGGADGGEYTLNGSKYVEILKDENGVTTDFTVKVEGDKFYQDGAIIYPDGKKFVLHEVYQRVPEPANVNNDMVGTWKMTSYTLTRNGKKTTEEGLSELQIYTPTHSMWVDKRKGKLWIGMVSTYTREGNKLMGKPLIATMPLDEKEKVNMTATVQGDQMTSDVKVTSGDGKVEEWHMVHQRVGKPKLDKAVTAK
jgi:hypothetical protein